VALEPGVVRGRVEADVSVVLPVDEACPGGGVVVDHSSDTEWVDVTEAARALLARQRLFLVVMPGQVIPEAVMGHGHPVVQGKLLLPRGILLGTHGVVHPPGGRWVDGVGVEVRPERLGSDGGGGGSGGGRFIVRLRSVRRIRGVVGVRGDVDLLHVPRSRGRV